MKKGNLKGIKLGLIFSVFLTATLIALPLRMYQLFTIVDSSTGFYSQINWTVYGLYSLCILVFLLTLGLSYFSANLPAQKSPSGRRVLLGILSFILAGGFLWDSVAQAGILADMYFAPEQILESLNFSYFAGRGAVPLGLQLILGVLSAVFFFMMGISYCSDKKTQGAYRLISLAPLFWTMMRIIHRFMRTISFLNVSDLFLELCMLCFLLIFFMTFARISADVGEKPFSWRIYGFGLSAAFLSLLTCVPRIILLSIGKAELISTASPVEWVDFAIAVFILGYILSTLRVKPRTLDVDRFEVVEK